VASIVNQINVQMLKFKRPINIDTIMWSIQGGSMEKCGICGRSMLHEQSHCNGDSEGYVEKNWCDDCNKTQHLCTEENPCALCVVPEKIRHEMIVKFLFMSPKEQEKYIEAIFNEMVTDGIAEISGVDKDGNMAYKCIKKVDTCKPYIKKAEKRKKNKAIAPQAGKMVKK